MQRDFSWTRGFHFDCIRSLHVFQRNSSGNEGCSFAPQGVVDCSAILKISAATLRLHVCCFHLVSSVIVVIVVVVVVVATVHIFAFQTSFSIPVPVLLEPFPILGTIGPPWSPSLFANAEAVLAKHQGSHSTPHSGLYISGI